MIKYRKISLTIFSLVMFFVFAVVVSAATTISTNISTGGTLTVSGVSTFNGSNTFGDAAGDINLFTGTLQASTTALFTTGLTTYGNSTFGDAAGDINLFTGTLQASTTALFSATTTFYGGVVTTNGFIGAGTTTPSTEIAASGAATTTLYLSSSVKGGCIELTGSNGTTVYRAYATTTGPLILEAGSCK